MKDFPDRIIESRTKKNKEFIDLIRAAVERRDAAKKEVEK